MQAEIVPPQLDKAELERYLRGLNSYKRETRETSLRQVATLSPELLLQLMREGSRFYRKRYRLSSCVEFALLLSCFPIGMILYALSADGVVWWALLVVAFIAIGWRFLTVPWRMYRSLVGVLEHTEDLKLIGPMITMYVRPDGLGYRRDMLGNMLCRLLPQLRFDHAGLLTVEQKQDMLRLLPVSIGSKDGSVNISALDLNIALQTLKALEQVGDESAIPAVKRLTWDSFNNNKTVQKAAEQCLKHLRSHPGQHKEMQTLLRATAVAESAPATLLRPILGVENAAPEQLLRPTAQDKV